MKTVLYKISRNQLDHKQPVLKRVLVLVHTTNIYWTNTFTHSTINNSSLLTNSTHHSLLREYDSMLYSYGKGKEAIPVQARTGPEGSRRLSLLDFKTIGTWRWYAPATFTPQKIFLILISIRGWVDFRAVWRVTSMKNSNDTIGNRTRDLPVCSAVPQPTLFPWPSENKPTLQESCISVRRPYVPSPKLVYRSVSVCPSVHMY